MDINSTETYQKLFTKLENPDVNYQNFVKKLAKYHFQVKAIIQASLLLQIEFNDLQSFQCAMTNFLSLSGYFRM